MNNNKILTLLEGTLFEKDYRQEFIKQKMKILEGGVKITFRKELMEQKNLSEDIKKDIYTAHTVIEMLTMVIENHKNNKKLIKDFNIILEKIEYYLQDKWNFPQDKKFHTLWFRNRLCSCDSISNINLFGTGNRFISIDCLLHGDNNKFN